jgi:hypothetical protein
MNTIAATAVLSIDDHQSSFADGEEIAMARVQVSVSNENDPDAVFLNAEVPVKINGLPNASTMQVSLSLRLSDLVFLAMRRVAPVEQA